MFRINYIKFINHPIFKDTKYLLSNNTMDGTYKSVIIGSNGTGKSMLLKEVCNIFITLISSIEQNRSDLTIPYDFTMSYVLNGEEFTISNESGLTIPDDIEKLPTEILALSYSLNDKFSILTKKNKLFTEKYKYMGIRSTTNNAFISKHRKSFIENIHIIFNSAERTCSLKQFFENMHLPKQYKLIFKVGTNYNKLFKETEYMSINTFNDILSVLVSKNKDKSKRFSDAKFEQLRENNNLKEKIVNFYNNTLLENNIKSKSSQLDYSIDIDNIDLMNDFIRDFDVINHLLSIEILKIAELEIIKNDNYAFNDSSSGEFHIINSITSIIAHIKMNSLLLIDEPEVSLHPNWQIKYIELLNKALTEYMGCHIIIATHSHFLISSLDKSNSIVLSTKKDSENGNIIVQNLDYDTYGWSAENILYNVFDIATTRNSYFETDLSNLVNAISNQAGTYEEISSLITKFRKFNITINDPLYEVIKMGETYLEKLR